MWAYALHGKSHFCITFLGIARPQSQFPHSCVCEQFICIPGSAHIFPCSRIGRPIREIYKFLTDIYECRNGVTEHYNSVLEITVSFLGIHNWETDIFIGFSLALHLQCGLYGVQLCIASQRERSSLFGTPTPLAVDLQLTVLCTVQSSDLTTCGRKVKGRNGPLRRRTRRQEKIVGWRIWRPASIFAKGLPR